MSMEVGPVARNVGPGPAWSLLSITGAVLMGRAVWRAFCGQVSEMLQVFSASELMTLLVGQQTVSADELVKALEFRNFTNRTLESTCPVACGNSLKGRGQGLGWRSVVTVSSHHSS